MRLLLVSCAPVVFSFTLSLACLRWTPVTVHDTWSNVESCCGVSPFFFFFYTSVFHTLSHRLTGFLLSRLSFCPSSTYLPLVWYFYSVCMSVQQSDEHVKSKWSSVRDDTSGLTPNKSSMLSFLTPLSVLDSVPSEFMLQAPYTSSLICCDGTAVSKPYQVSFELPRIVGWISLLPKFPRSNSQDHQQSSALLTYWSLKKSMMWPHSSLLSGGPGPPWPNLKYIFFIFFSSHWTCQYLSKPQFLFCTRHWFVFFFLLIQPSEVKFSGIIFARGRFS